MKLCQQTSLWMVVLTFTAVILGAILLSSQSKPAEAAMLNAQTGFSLMTAGTNGGDEALIVVDKTSQKMIVYTFKGNDLVPLAPAISIR